ncbi:MAG: WYL domain-containing transcriptional regulator [Desulfobulbaceae bacterium]|nr:WYL domain-containing transcriptional regulator [Desulfobulbaceae bacterium]
MAKYKPQHSRLLFIDRKVNEGRYPNCRTLAEEWEVSRKTIQRDLDYMRYQLDAPIEYSSEKRGYYYTEQNFKLPAISIRESDLFAIYLAEKVLEQYEGTPVYDNLCTVFQKIEDSLPDKIVPGSAHDFSRFSFLCSSTTLVDPEVWNTVFSCLRNLNTLEMEYQSRQSLEPISRKLDPYHGIRFDGDWYVVGFCHLREEIRTFSLARIISARKLAERFKIPPDFDFRKLTGSHFGVHWTDNEIYVRILFKPAAAKFIRERHWHASQGIEEQKDGSLILSLTVNHLLELKRWILSWGSGAKVLEPEELAGQIRQECREMAGMAGN